MDLRTVSGRHIFMPAISSHKPEHQSFQWTASIWLTSIILCIFPSCSFIHFRLSLQVLSIMTSGTPSFKENSLYYYILNSSQNPSISWCGPLIFVKSFVYRRRMSLHSALIVHQAMFQAWDYKLLQSGNPSPYTTRLQSPRSFSYSSLLTLGLYLIDFHAQPFNSFKLMTSHFPTFAQPPLFII